MFRSIQEFFMEMSPKCCCNDADDDDDEDDDFAIIEMDGAASPPPVEIKVSHHFDIDETEAWSIAGIELLNQFSCSHPYYEEKSGYW